MRRVLVTATVCAAALIGGAAADDVDVMARYRAYAEAYDEGRFDDALREGEAAWRAAEAEWGDANETGMLAFNLASLLAKRDRVAEALEPARRALALAESGAAPDVSAVDAAMVLGMAEIATGAERAGRRRLEDALEARLAEGVDDDDLSMTAWYALAQANVKRSRWRDAQEAASHVRVAASRFGEAGLGLVANASVIEGASALAADRYDDALDAFEAGLDAFPDQSCVVDDPRIANLMAWRMATESVVESDWSAAKERRRLRLRHARRAAEAAAEDDTPDICDPLWDSEWTSRVPPEFPRRELSRSRVGAVLVGYDLTPDGTTDNVRILAAVPSEDSAEFDDESIEAVEQWIKVVPEGTPDYCFKDLNVIMSFNIED